MQLLGKLALITGADWVSDAPLLRPLLKKARRSLHVFAKHVQTIFSPSIDWILVDVNDVSAVDELKKVSSLDILKTTQASKSKNRFLKVQRKIEKKSWVPMPKAPLLCDLGLFL